MSDLTDKIEKVRSVLKHWDDGHISAMEFESKMDEMYFGAILDELESGEEFISFGSCCCAAHPPDRTFKIQITVRPHGRQMKRCE